MTARVGVGLSLGCAVIAVALWALAAREFLPQRALDTRGLKADATVVAIQHSLEPVATLRFQTRSGATVIAKTKEFAGAKAGDAPEVTYDPRHPTRVRAATASSDYVGAALFAAGAQG